MSEIELPWRMEGLDGHRSDYGPTYTGGGFSGGGPASDRSLTVRLRTPMGEPATVSIDLCDDSRLKRSGHGCTVAVDPAAARQAAAALVAAADQAEAEMAKWQETLDKLRTELQTARLRDAAGRAGAPETEVG